MSWTPATFAGGAAAVGASADLRLEPEAVLIATQADPASSARQIRRAINRLEHDAKKALRQASALQERKERFNHFFFSVAGFKPDGNQNSVDGLLLHDVLRRRQGTCVGLAQVYLILAERLDLPVVAASTPIHLFARWVDGESRINTELLEEGAEHPDSYYQAQHRIHEPDPARPVFLRNLTSRDVAARIYNNLGVIRSRSGLLEAAAEYYARSIELDPRFPAPHYNRGVDDLNAGRPKEALANFDAALSIYPADPWALNNRALAHLRLGQDEESKEDLRAALALDPDFPAARKNLQLLTPEAGIRARGPAPPPGSGPQTAPVSGEAAGPRP